ncbi:MAG: hypothetical protein ACM3KR_01620 [Deltaproteobacteria bacterium]
MELRIKNYKQEEAAVIFECSYGGRDFSALANPVDKVFKQEEYEATDKVKERIGTILMTKAEKLIKQ